MSWIHQEACTTATELLGGSLFLWHISPPLFVLFGIVFVIGIWHVAPADQHGDAELSVGTILNQWSPQGDFIAFSHRRGVFAIDTDGTNLRSLWPDQGDNKDNPAGSPNISPDGSRIIYAAFNKGDFLPWNEDHWEIVASDPNGSNRKTLVKSRGLKASPVWSPEGSLIAFVSSGNQKAPHLRKPAQVFTMAPDGSNLKNITPSIMADHIAPPVWSPDGRLLAFVTISFSQLFPAGTSYTVGSAGSGLSRVGPTMSLPA